MEDVQLSKSVTVARYRDFEATGNRDAIADFISERFEERYVKPLRGDPAEKHGFCTMAICCLMIEALESFWQGWPDTMGRSRQAFRSFFKRCAEQESKLGIFADRAGDFYESVRCGILHQAKTTKGWRIRRKGPLFDPSTKMVNATLFHDELEEALVTYCDTLKRSESDSEIWCNLRNKMGAVIENCRPT